MDSVFIFSIILLGGLGLLAGIGLSIASKIFNIVIDPKIEQIIEILPRANCGACGFPGCASYAEAVVIGKADIEKCIPGGREVQEKVAEIMNLSVGIVIETKVTVVQCAGGHDHVQTKAIYQGIQDCAAAVLVAGGSRACAYGCLGFGSCVSACPFNAMYMGDDGLPHVVEDKCTGCSICVSVCPREVLALIPRRQKVYLACVSHDRGKNVKNVCKVGCIGCSLCAQSKVTPSGSIHLDNNLPVIVKNDADDLLMAVDKCPRKCFHVRDGKKKTSRTCEWAYFRNI